MGASPWCFLVVERRHPDALVPMHLFASRIFWVANAMTLLVYGALGAMLFFLTLQLQVVRVTRSRPGSRRSR